jgi:hypothetical protein
MPKSNDAVPDCSSGKYNSNQKLQKWIIFRLGIIESENRETGTRGAINIWQISKLVLPEIVTSISSPTEVLCNMLEMKDKGLLGESKVGFRRYFDEDNDMRSFYLTSWGVIQFRKELEPLAKMLIEQQQQYTKIIDKTRGDSKVKRSFIEILIRFKDKLESKLEEEAIDVIVGVAREHGIKAVTFLVNLVLEVLR